MTAAAASGRSRPSRRSSTVDTGSTPSLSPTTKTWVAPTHTARTDVDDRCRTGGIAAPAHRGVEQRTDDLAHGCGGERHGDSVVVELGQAGDDAFDVIGGVALPSRTVGPRPLAPGRRTDVVGQ